MLVKRETGTTIVTLSRVGRPNRRDPPERCCSTKVAYLVKCRWEPIMTTWHEGPEGVEGRRTRAFAGCLGAA
jgi:hypothetical protein